MALALAACVAALRYPAPGALELASTWTIHEMMYGTDSGPLGLKGPVSVTASLATAAPGPVGATLSVILFDAAVVGDIGVRRGDELSVCCSFEMMRLGRCGDAALGAWGPFGRGRVAAFTRARPQGTRLSRRARA